MTEDVIMDRDKTRQKTGPEVHTWKETETRSKWEHKSVSEAVIMDRREL